jgi:hypothetical protein
MSSEVVKELSAAQKAKAILLETGDIPTTKEGVAEVYKNQPAPKEAVTPDSVETDTLGVAEVPPVEGTVADGNIESLVAGGQTVKVDWNDKVGLRKAVQLAADRNVQKTEKDRALELNKTLSAEKSAVEAKNAELTNILTAFLDQKKLGADALLKHTYGKSMSDILAEAEERTTWTPEQVSNYELRQELAELKAKSAGTETASNETLAQIRKEKEDTQRLAVETHFSASYRKHSFEGKLGGAELEDDMDTNLFNNVKSKFDGREMTTISPAEVEQAFKMERTRLVKLYGTQAETRTASEIERKKKDSLAAVQAKAGRGEGKVTAQQRFDALRAAGKHSDIMRDPTLRALLG